MHVFMYMCLCKCVRAANSAATWPGSEGLWGMSFFRTLTPSDPAQPKKSWESDCRLADRLEEKFIVRQIAEAERLSDSGKEREND